MNRLASVLLAVLLFLGMAFMAPRAIAGEPTPDDGCAYWESMGYGCECVFTGGAFVCNVWFPDEPVVPVEVTEVAPEVAPVVEVISAAPIPPPVPVLPDTRYAP